MRPIRGGRRVRRGCAAALALAVALGVAACSASSGAGGQLGSLASALSTPAGTPVLGASSLTGQYAFVFGNQIWIKRTADAAPTQLTHLVLPGGAYSAWGPLAWSPDGARLAFTLVEDASGADHPSSAGQIYIADSTTGDVVSTAGTAGVDGHAYAWYGNHVLFYSSGGAINFYDYTDPSDPRPYVAVPPVVAAPADAGAGTGTGATGYVTYGDLAIVGQTLLATRIVANRLASRGQVGTAAVYAYGIPQGLDEYTGGNLGIDQSSGLDGGIVNDLGAAYVDAGGALTAGAWLISPPTGAMVAQRVLGVDAQGGTVSSHICYDAAIGDYCDVLLFTAAGTMPLAVRPQFGLSHSGILVAMSGATLDTERIDGTQPASYAPGASDMPQWSPDDQLVVATQQVAAPDASGVVDFETNVIAYPPGARASVLIGHGEDFSWGP
jgi:hypothetical protein